MSNWGIIAIVVFVIIGAVAGLVYVNLHQSSEQRKIAKMVYSNALVIDVRTPEEYNAGHYENAINIPHTEILNRVDEIGDRSTSVVLYCSAGNRSAIAMRQLKTLGFRNIVNGISMELLP